MPSYKKDSENTSEETTAKLSEEIAQLQRKAFSTQMNPHFVFNALAAVQYFITSGDKKASLLYLSIFSKLIRFYLKQINKETVLLSEEKDMLEAYLTFQKLRYNNKFEYHIDYNKKDDDKEAIIPSFMLQTLFEDLIERAIYNKYKNYKIKIAFEIFPQKVLVFIAFQYDDNPEKKATYFPDYRKQLIKWQDQIRQLNKFKNYSIKKKVTFNKNSDGKGGIITLNLPNLN